MMSGTSILRQNIQLFSMKTEIESNPGNEMRIAGFEIKHTEGYLERYAMIDKEIVWYGSMNLLGKPDADDSIMRVIDGEIAEELLLMTFGRGL